jgi:hypothetical protein
MTLETQALREHEQATQEVATLATRSQGGAGAATALDVALVDERALTRDPAGLSRPPVNGSVAQRHAALIKQAKDAVADEVENIREKLHLIGRHTGDESRLALKTIDDAVNAAMAAADRADLLTPSEVSAEVSALRLPRATDAAATVEAAWVAVRAAERGLSIETLFRLGAIDVDLLDTLLRYLELAATVITASSTAASEAIRQRAGSDSSHVAEQVRAAATALVERCEVPE